MEGCYMMNRNEICSCGSGLKYKKCCLPFKEFEKSFMQHTVITDYLDVNEDLYFIDFNYKQFPYQARIDLSGIASPELPKNTPLAKETNILARLTKDLISGEGKSVKVTHHSVE